jgi:hypothetical protein
MGKKNTPPSPGPGPKCPVCGVQTSSAGALIRHRALKRH